MRKMKKINGYLVVRFNDREKQGYPHIGNFGVIDAELYTGHIDVDLDAFEYNDADNIEIAVEQARGLDAEQDFSDEEPFYTIVTESAEEVTEEEVEPGLLIKGMETKLETQIKSKHYPFMDPLAAAHELVGYKSALYDLGLLGEDEAVTDLRQFGELCEFQDDDGHHVDVSLPMDGELLGYVCDEVCRHREGRTQEELDAICEKCKLERWAKAWTQEPVKRYHLGKPGPSPDRAEPETFQSLPPSLRNSIITRRVYALGRVLGEDCPGDDCTIYRNIFKMALELDEAASRSEGYVAQVLQQRLREHVKELREMYDENFAVKQFREGLKP